MRRLNHDDGNIVIITALLATTLFGFLALTVDVGAILVRQSSLQSGADAAALAIAKRCANAVVTVGAPPCDTSLGQELFDANALIATEGVDVTVPVLESSHEGRVGRITVVGSMPRPVFFAGVLGHDSGTVEASATARWGPLTAIDEAFPLAVCQGALPGPDSGEITLTVDPAATDATGSCDGAPGEPPFGWIPPDDLSDCSSKITIMPSTYVDVAPADTPPSGSNCDARVEELFNDIAGYEFCHDWPWWRGYHCHSFSNPASERTRVLPVYDAGAGASGSHPAVSLIAFEFTGARIGDNEAHRSGGAACAEGMHCIRGTVRDFIPPTDGPIIDPTLAALPEIEDTTVLDIRLVD